MTDSKKLDLILSKLDRQEERLDKIEAEVKDIKLTLKEHSKILDEHSKILNEHSKILNEHSRMFVVYGNVLQEHGGRITEIEKSMAAIQNDLREMKVTFENEIRRDIMRVAEAHLDLSRNLHEAKKPNQEIEMLTIRVNILETDMRTVKQKIS